MNIFVVSTIVLSVWSAVSSIVGVKYGSELATRAQRKQWTDDNKKVEYREILKAMSEAVAPIMATASLNQIGNEERATRLKAENHSYEAMDEALFIADELEILGIRKD
jgi:hypothetical protein